MQCSADGATPTGLFALVAYIPNPLGSFLDRLRLELVPGCAPHAHVTILPPRFLNGDLETALGQVREWARAARPFHIEAAGVDVFDDSSVIYISVGDGLARLHQAHAELNTERLSFAEFFDYHPHITVAQWIPPEKIPELKEIAARRWAEFPDERSFLVDRVVFVKNITNDTWEDVEELPLGPR